MGHRHLHNAPQIPEANGDPGWNQANQSYNPFAMAGTFGSSSLVLPVENMTVQGGYIPSFVPRSSGHSSSIPNAAPAPYQPAAPFPYQLAANNYLHHPSSSSLSVQAIPRRDELFYNQEMGSGAHKRKTPGVPHLSDKGSTSRLHDVGSSSSLHLLADEWQMYEPPGYRANTLSISGEPMARNVRIRAEVDPGLNPVRTTQPSYQPDSVELWRQSSNTQLGEGNQCLVQPFAGHGANSGTEISGSGFFSHYHNSLNAVNNHANGALGSGMSTSNMNLVPQNGNCNENPNQPILNFMAPSSNFQLGQVTSSNGRLQIAAQSQPSVGSGMSSHNPTSNMNLVPHNANCNENPNQPILNFMAPSSNPQLGQGTASNGRLQIAAQSQPSVGSGMSSHNLTSNRNRVPQNANCNENPNQPILNFMAPSSNFQLGQATASNGRLQIAAQSQSSVGGGMSSHNPSSNRNVVPQNSNCHENPSQPILDFTALSSNFHVGQATASNGRLQMVAQSQPSRQRTVFSTVSLTNGEGHGRTGIPRGMHRSYTQEDVHIKLGQNDQLRSEKAKALMAAHQSAIRGSRNPLDHHRDMRLDVDNMSYEELLVLGERIGSVGTGLSDSSISKCLTESIFVAPDQYEDDDDDGRCVICLEEYKHMDDVGNLKCHHDFHVVCIKKWLSLKNLCPICKSAAMD